MEKLVYVLWKKNDESADTLPVSLLTRVLPGLFEQGAHAVSANLVDAAAAYAAHLRITQTDEPMAGTVSVWLDTHLERAAIENALGAVSKRLAGYLVVESVPIRNTQRPPGSDGRIDGLCTVAFLEKPATMEYEAWREQWQGHHTRVAIETQSTFLYVQNVVTRALSADAPPWTAIVEECFPKEAATDPMVFYNAGNDEKRLQENQRRMIDSCRKFIDFSTLESHPMSAYVLTP